TSEYTATVGTPSSRQVRMTRTAISPRLAMSTFPGSSGTGSSGIGGRILRAMPPGSPTHGGMPPDPRAWDVDPSRLAGTRFATVRFFDEIGSTNTEAVEAARAGAGEGLVVVADHQTAGRGRLGRTWSTAPGTALLVSVLLRPPLPIDEVPIVLMAAGLAACDGVEGAAGIRTRLEW